MLSDSEILEIAHGISGRHDEAVAFGKRMGIKVCYVESMRNVFGISEPPAPSMTEEEVAKVIDMYQSGMTQRQIARELGCSEKTIYRHIANNGIKTRTRQWSKREDMALAQMVKQKNDVGFMASILQRNKKSVYRRIRILKEKREYGFEK